MANKKKRVGTIANQITILRILTIPAILIALIEEQRMLAVGLLSFCIVTDFLDGLAARMMGEQTKLGAFLDPMADKLLLTTVYMALMIKDMVPSWVFVVVFSRDLLIVLGWTVIFILTGSSNIQLRVLGKVTTAAQMAAALACILNLPTPIQPILIWFVILLSASSAIDYVLIGEKKLGEWN